MVSHRGFQQTGPGQSSAATVAPALGLTFAHTAAPTGHNRWLSGVVHTALLMNPRGAHPSHNFSPRRTPVRRTEWDSGIRSVQPQGEPLEVLAHRRLCLSESQPSQVACSASLSRVKKPSPGPGDRVRVTPLVNASASITFRAPTPRVSPVPPDFNLQQEPRAVREGLLSCGVGIGAPEPGVEAGNPPSSLHKRACSHQPCEPPSAVQREDTPGGK